MFAGSHQLSVDDKGRLAIPARFRQSLAEQCGGQLVVTLGPNPCLELYPAPEFSRLAQDIQQMEDRQTADVLKQWFIGFASEAEIDRQGRLLLPPLLRKRVGIDGGAVLMGQITRFDLWSESAWQTRFGEDAGALGGALETAFRTLKR